MATGKPAGYKTRRSPFCLSLPEWGRNWVTTRRTVEAYLQSVGKAELLNSI